MSRSEVPLWWDRNNDLAGRPIRPDVRAAAHGIWGCACGRAESLISDCSQAAELMESTVAEVSRYLDRSGVAVFSQKMDGLVMLAFQRALQRRVAKLNRLKIVGGSEQLSRCAVDWAWSRRIDARLDLEQVVQRLCERSRTVLALRYAGYTWKEAARLLGSAVPALRSAFWRDVTRAKGELKNHRGGEPEIQATAQQQSSTNNAAR